MTVVVAVFTAVLFILSLPASSAAATRTWTGGGSAFDTTWSNPNNWAPAIAPVNGDDLVFPNIGLGFVTRTTFRTCWCDR